MHLYNAIPGLYRHAGIGSESSKKRKKNATPLIYCMLCFTFLIAGLSACANPDGEDDVKNGLIAHFTFNKTWKDKGVQDNHATPHQLWRGRDAFTYKRSGSALFQSAGSKLSIPLNISADALPEITFTAWIKPDLNLPQASANMTIFSNMLQGTGRAFSITFHPETGKTGLIANVEKGQTQALPVELEDWSFVAITYDQHAGLVTVYANDEKRTNRGTTGPGYPALNVGYCMQNQDQYFIGKMDEIRIYNRVLGDEEIFQLRDSLQPANQLFARNKRVFSARSGNAGAKENWNLEGENILSISRSDTIHPIRFLLVQADKQSFTEVPGPRYFFDAHKPWSIRNWFKSKGYAHIAVEFETPVGKPAYVDLQDVMFFSTSHPKFLAPLLKFVNFNTIWNFLITIGVLLVLYLAMIYYAPFDEVLVDWSNTFANPGVAWPVLVFMISAFITGILYRYAEPAVYQYVTSPIVWPVGHTFVVWVMFSLLAIMALTLVVSLIESIVRAGILSLPRFIILTSLSVVTFLVYSFAVAQSFLLAVFLLFAFLNVHKHFAKAAEQTCKKPVQWIYVGG